MLRRFQWVFVWCLDGTNVEQVTAKRKTTTKGGVVGDGERLRWRQYRAGKKATSDVEMQKGLPTNPTRRRVRRSFYFLFFLKGFYFARGRRTHRLLEGAVPAVGPPPKAA